MTRLIALLELAILGAVLVLAVAATAARGDTGQVCPQNHPHCRPFPCRDAAGRHCGPQ